MEQAGYEFEVQVSQKEEHYVSTYPDEIVKELALLKARDIAEQNETKDLVVIGADTVVAFEGAILGKPKTKEHAFEMIKSFQGRRHQVYTGVAILDYDTEGTEKVVNEAVRTDVYVNRMTDEEIWSYIESDNVMDKAGSYAIQESCCKHINKIYGDYYNIMGLPISKLYQILKGKKLLNNQ